jgi:predicted nucleotidyltransferase
MAVLTPPAGLELPMDGIAALCRRRKIRELALFGSQARGDARPDSDVDFLVEFEPDEEWDLGEIWAMREEFAELIGRHVDMVEIAAVRNPYRKAFMLRDKQVIYAIS